MVSFSAPITGGRVSTSNPSGSAKSLGLAAAGVALMFIVIGLAGVLINLASGVPVLGRITGLADGQANFSVKRAR